MIKFNRIRTYAFIGLILFSISSCDQAGYLENINKLNLTDETMWADEVNADIFLNDSYREIVSKSNQPDNLDEFTDDSDPNFYYTSFNWKKGVIVPTSNNYSVWGQQSGPANDANWPGTYIKIRKLNQFIQKVNENSENFTTLWLTKRIDEARFLRAYYYSELFFRIGGLCIVTEPQDRLTMTEDELYLPRSTFEETFNFIVDELSSIVENGYLPVKYNTGNSNAGRATLGAALALKGWVQLFAASPAYNSAEPAVPNTGDSKDLQSFGTPDPSRWAAAAATNKQFIETYGHKGSGAYKLFSPMTTFWYEANEYNSEVIWDRQHVGVILPNTYDTYGGPVVILNTYYNYGNYNPTQKLVDVYQMANGKDITDPTSGYDPQNPYVGREKRFYDFIVHDGATYKQDWMPTSDIIYTRIDLVTPSKNQIDYGSAEVTNTGYYFKKRLDNLRIPRGNMVGANHVFYRYAEVLLNYAEAQNEAVGPDASVYEAVNTIRTRQGTDLPELQPGLTQDQMRDAIRRERRIELVFENKRLWDIWRWKTAMEVMNEDLGRMVITNSVPNDNSGVWVYTPSLLNTSHVYTQKMYFNPIPQAALDQNTKLKQNWGY